MILPVIMAGGSGTRLWPLSRSMYPKQFLNIVGDHTMLQDTVLRLKNIETDALIVICNNEHRFLAAEQLQQIENKAHIILEPVGRNTAPAIALAALKAQHSGDDPLLLVLAADHVINDGPAFEAAVESATQLAEQDKLVTFGIVANAPETGYGYIHRGKQFSASENEAYIVNQFVEKPNLEKAQQYLDSGEYYWNSGMFMFKASRYLSELEQYFPEILNSCKQCMESSTKDLDFIRIDEALFKQCPSESIDYAVMEKTQDAVVVPLDAQWSDIGSWSAIWDVSEKDANGNRTLGDVIAVDSKNCLVHGSVKGEQRLITLLGLENIVVIDTKDSILVADKTKVQEVKQIVDELKSSNRDEWKIHREVYRPWGKYDSIDVGGRYQVKRITVKAGAKLSVQMHHHRAEHWVVVSGTAKVTNGEDVFFVSENESTYIPIGRVHALENPGKLPLELIEVQTGSYLGEDDIVRLEDNYGRA